MQNGKSPGFPSSLKSPLSRFNMDERNDMMKGYLEAVQTLAKAQGNVWDLLNMANLETEEKARAVASMFNRGMRELSEIIEENPALAADITAKLSNQSRWYELPPPLTEVLSFCVGANASRGWRAKQVNSVMTDTMVIHPDDKDVRVFSNGQNQQSISEG